MAALDFPNAPTVNQLFTAANGVTYIWTGTLWTVYLPTALTGPLAAPTWDQSNAAASVLGIIPTDDTIPQIGEGSRLFQRVFTASNPANAIDVDCDVALGATGVCNIVLALFIDNAPDAVAAKFVTANTSWFNSIRLRWRGVLSAGPHTFEIRAGGHVAAAYFNGLSARYFGGSLYETLAISEVGVGVKGPPGDPGPAGAGSYLIQSKYGEYTSNAGHPVVMPYTTVPQITDGDQIIAVPFTPLNATSRIRFRVQGQFCINASAILVAALCDSRQAASILGTTGANVSNGSIFPFAIEGEMPAVSTAARTYSLRVGTNTGTPVYFNGGPGSGVYPPTARTTLIVDEISP